MSTSDHLDGPDPGWPPALPATYRPAGPPAPAPAPAAWDDPLPPPEAGPAPGRLFNLRTVLRAARRHWWQILLLWTAGSAGLVALVYTRVKPSFEVYSLLQVEAPVPQVLAQSPLQAPISDTQLETQVRLITSPKVLGAALQDKRLGGRVPEVLGALDPEASLREQLRAAIIPKTNLINVSMSAPDAAEAATLVNAVVDAYLEYNRFRAEQQAKELKGEFQTLRDRLREEVSTRQREMLAMAGQGDVATADAPLGAEDAAVRSPEEIQNNVVTLEEYKALSRQVGDLEERISLTNVDLARLRAERPMEAMDRGQELEALVKEALQADGNLARLRQAYSEAEDRYEKATSLARKPSDPARRQATQELADLRQEYWGLSNRREAELRDRIARELAADQGMNEADRAIASAERELARLKEELRLKEDKRRELRVRSRNDRVDSLQQEFARVDLIGSQDSLKKVEDVLQQLDWDIERSKPLIEKVADAQVSLLSTSNNRKILMAAAPAGVLALLLALFTLLEMRAARVGDPDDLPGRVRVGVIGVVPPLPSARGALGRNSPAKLQRQVEEFVQSLDHLRVTLVAAPGATGGRRAVLITSACGSEGKTTLAAQLAGRCANAGLSTVLVDADLRRPRLAELLEVPEGPGLADVLAGEVEPEAAMVVIGSAGGFHLLPAGTQGHDPSRLLQGDRLGQLMARLRATFDVVLVDAPPVLAVPDALLIGRWTDGAVLAVRHDASRFPLVERANRRLASIGIPVLGAVVNGVRSPDSAYSGYSYNYSSSSSSAAGRAEPPPGVDDLA